MNDLLPPSEPPASQADWKPPLEVMVEAPPLKISDERIGEVAAQLGLVSISGEKMRALRDLGATWAGTGLVRTANAGAAVTHTALIASIGQLGAMLAKEKDTETVIAITRQIASLSNALTKATVGLAKALPQEHGRPDEHATRKSFMPGAVVGQMAVHYHADSGVAKSPEQK